MNPTAHAIWSTIEHFVDGRLAAIQHVRITVRVELVPAGPVSPAAVSA